MTSAIAGIERDLQAMSARHIDERRSLIQSEIAVRRTELDAQVERLTAEGSQVAERLRGRREAENELEAARQRAVEVDLNAENVARACFRKCAWLLASPAA